MLAEREVKKVYVWNIQVRPTIIPITTPWIYHNSDLWLISLSSDWTNWITIADKNLWATTVYNNWDALSEANCWKYYQWGNNYWFPSSWFTISWTQVNAGTYWPWNYYYSDIFISNTYSWDTSRNENLWWRISGTKAAMQWPCPDGFHVPTQSEFASLMTYMFDNNTLSASVIKIPFWWYINTWWSLTQRWVLASYRTSQSNRNWTRIAPYWYNIMYYNRPKYRDYYSWVSERPVQWRSIRPFKNEAAQPDNSRTKLY